jgi:DNA-directed RNA polymerase subunit alpha
MTGVPMAGKWQNFEMPRGIVCEESSYSNFYGKFIAEPFERGYGTTVGNALRRVLVSSIEGSAVTSVRIEGVLHEFSTLSGVAEDIAEVILNVKNLVIRCNAREPRTIHIKADKKGEIKAGDIVTDPTVEIINPELHIATLAKNVKFAMEMEVDRGRGYVPAERNKKENQPIGVIPIDSIFTPVKKVNYTVENTRVGQITDYDRLILEIWTNGSIDPKEALIEAANILQKHLDMFLDMEVPPVEEPVEVSQIDEELMEKLNTSVSELELSVRSANCLREANIKTIGDLVRRGEDEMLRYRNFGLKSLREITDVLKKMNLRFGMRFEDTVLESVQEDARSTDISEG